MKAGLRIPSWSEALELAARAGYAARGFVYVSLGMAALLAALDLRGRPSGSAGTIAILAGWPFGQVWLGAVGAGLLAFAGWRALQSIFDVDRIGRGPVALGKRAGQAISGLVYGALAFSAFELLDEVEDAGEADEAAEHQAQHDAAEAMSLPYGQWLLVAVGVFVAGMTAANLVKALAPGMGGRLGCGPITHRWVCRLGRLGYLGRGLAFAPLAYTLIRAGLSLRPGVARDLGGALGSLERQPLGSWLLAMVAAGLIAFGLFAFVEARFRRIHVPDELSPGGPSPHAAA